jgi:hypothetical protein
MSDLAAQVQAAEAEWLQLWVRGPQRLRSDRMLQAGDRAPDLVLPSASGGQVPLGDCWPQGPTLLIFWRHYG